MVPAIKIQIRFKAESGRVQKRENQFVSLNLSGMLSCFSCEAQGEHVPSGNPDLLLELYIGGSRFALPWAKSSGN